MGPLLLKENFPKRTNVMFLPLLVLGEIPAEFEKPWLTKN